MLEDVLNSFISNSRDFLITQVKVPIFDISPTSFLKAFVLILQFQVKYNVSIIAIRTMVTIICNFFLPSYLYPIFPKIRAALKKFMHVVGLGYNHIHCCPKDCIIYYGKYKDYNLPCAQK